MKEMIKRNGRPLLRDDDPTSRITITLPRSLLEAIDAAGSNRSATIARLLIAVLMAKK